MAALGLALWVRTEVLSLPKLPVPPGSALLPVETLGLSIRIWERGTSPSPVGAPLLPQLLEPLALVLAPLATLWGLPQAAVAG